MTNSKLALYLKEHYNLIIGERTDEELKIKYNDIMSLSDETIVSIKGRDAISGLPRLQNIKCKEVQEAIRGVSRNG